MFLLAAVGQNTGVDARVQGLHAALQHSGNSVTSVTSVTGTPAAAIVDAVEPVDTSFTPCLVQTAGELRQVSFVVHGNEGAAQGQTIELLHRH